jgi:thiamine kinase-like enzyme
LKLTPAKNGYCNEVFEVERNDSSRAIVKVYSNASKMRVEPDERGKFDVLLSTLGISPDVIATSELGIAHQFIIGNPMAEMDIHSDAKFSKKLAHIISKLHRENQMDYKGSERCLVWKWIDLMLQEIEDSTKWQELPSYVDYEILREEVRMNRSIIEEANFPTTLTHGDLKPSNIMILEDDSLKLIDLELSGLNYRGFDLMKLYRADCEFFSEESFFRFLYEYHADCNPLNKERTNNIRGEVEQLALECRIFEPLTWLEVINLNMKEMSLNQIMVQCRHLYFSSFYYASPRKWKSKLDKPIFCYSGSDGQHTKNRVGSLVIVEVYSIEISGIDISGESG